MDPSIAMLEEQEVWEPLGRLDLQRLAADPRVVYVVDDRLRIRWRNQPLPGWDVGRPIVEAIHGPQRTFYEALFHRMLASAFPREHDYDCPTPELFRRFRLRMEPTDGAGLLLLHTPLEERPHEPSPERLRAHAYVDSHGSVAMCGHCRRARRPGTDRWDWAPELLEFPPPATIQTLCPECYARYYPPH